MYHPIEPRKEDIEEFKKIVKEDHGKKLSNEEARESAYNLLNFFNLLLHLDRKQAKTKNNEHP